MSKFVPIKGYGDSYLINSKGVIKATARPEGQNVLVASGLGKNQSLRVNLSHKGKVTSLRLDKLVADHFVPNPNKYNYVINKSGNKADVSASNLQFVKRPINNGTVPIKAIEAMALSYLSSSKSIKTIAPKWNLTVTTCRRLVMEWCENNGRLDDYKAAGYKNQVAYLNSKKTGSVKEINQYDLDGNLIATFPSLKEAAKAMGVKEPSISRAVSSTYRTSGGYRWKYTSPKQNQK